MFGSTLGHSYCLSDFVIFKAQLHTSKYPRGIHATLETENFKIAVYLIMWVRTSHQEYLVALNMIPQSLPVGVC